MDTQPGPSPQPESQPDQIDTSKYIVSPRKAQEIAVDVNKVLDEGSERLNPETATPADKSRRGDEIGYATDIAEANHKYGRTIGEGIRGPVVNMLDKSLERAKMTDALTGLANQAAFELARDSADQDPDIAVGMLDGNYFGQVNKTEGLGHSAGNALLKTAGDVLREASSGYRHIRLFRYGGDEFTVLGPPDEVEAVLANASRLFDERMLSDEPLDDGHGSRFETSRYRAVGNLSLPGTMGENFLAADAKLKAEKDARKARDTINQSGE